MALETPDCAVTHCGTRLQAVVILQRGVFDLLIFDINLPDGSGTGAVADIAARRRPYPWDPAYGK